VIVPQQKQFAQLRRLLTVQLREAETLSGKEFSARMRDALTTARRLKTLNPAAKIEPRIPWSEKFYAAMYCPAWYAICPYLLGAALAHRHGDLKGRETTA